MTTTTAPTLRTSRWPAVTGTPLLELTLGDLLRRLAHEVPDRIGLVEAPPPPLPNRRWTYAQLLHAAEGSAHALLRHFEPGERIAVWAQSSAEWCMLQHGAALAGLVLVTVNPAYLEEEVHHVLATSGAAGLFHAPEYRGCDMAAVAAVLRRRLTGLRASFDLSQWAAFTAGAAPAVTGPLPRVSPDDVAQIQFTSGTTGRPKGARLHHLGLINTAHLTARRVGFPEGGVWATAMPLFHVGGSTGSQLGAMTSRGTFVLQPAFDAGDMLRIVEDERVQHIHAVPTMVMRMLDHPERAHRDLSSLATIMSGGSLVPATMIERARVEMGCRICITYGQTEASGVVSATSPDDTLEHQTSTIGRPAPHVEVRIADPVTGAVLPLGAPGEIQVRGYQVMHGYFNLPAGATDVVDAVDAVDTAGWLHTGDIATMDADGVMRITGRLKDCIIRGGENIYPREIEDIVAQHPGVLEVQVVGAPDAQWGEVVAAVLRLRPEAPTPLELFNWCRARLAAYKCPERWYVVDAYPATTSGKIQKFALREQIATGVLQAQPFVKPRRDPATARAARADSGT